MGYFYKIFRSDVFVFDDDVQFTNTTHQYYNYVKINGSKFKVALPIKYSFGDAINEVKVCHSARIEKMMKTLRMGYCNTPHFDEIYPLLEREFERKEENLAELDIRLTMEFCEKFGLDRMFLKASVDLPTSLRKNERNVWQCMQVGCGVYYSGLGGKLYNDEKMYEDNGIKVVYTDYEPPIYRQKGKPFIENLSVFDYVCCNGFKLPEDWKR